MPRIKGVDGSHAWPSFTCHMSRRVFVYFFICSFVYLCIYVQGASKKMSDSDFSLKSVPGVGFYLFRGVLDAKF